MGKILVDVEVSLMFSRDNVATFSFHRETKSTVPNQLEFLRIEQRGKPECTATLALRRTSGESLCLSSSDLVLVVRPLSGHGHGVDDLLQAFTSAIHSCRWDAGVGVEQITVRRETVPA